MSKHTPIQLAARRFLFFVLNALGVFLLLVPISMMPSNFIWPQLALLASLALILRAPELVPYWLIGIVFLISDFLLGQPMGLGAFVALAATEFLRRNRAAFVEMLFFGEWVGISLIVLAAAILRSFLLAVTLAEATPFTFFIQQFGLNIIAYPIVVVAVQILFAVDKSKDTESYPVRRTS